MKKFNLLAASVLGLTLLATGCSSTPDDVAKNKPTSSATAQASATAAPKAPTAPKPTPVAPKTNEPVKTAPIAAGTALATLGTLAIKDADTAKYNRDLFGSPWKDVDNNSCDTRNDMLKRDLTNPVLDSDNCTVLTGTMVDPYTGTTINFDRSKGGGGGLDIDHLVALSAGFKSGASTWSPEKRLAFANDPLNLLTSGSGPNRAKGDKDASEWLPATAGNPSFNCQYVARQVAVKAKYGAWLLPSEKTAMETVLNTCPNEPLPVDTTIVKVQESQPVAPAPAPAPKPAPEAVPAPIPAPAPANGSAVDYGTCAKAKAAGGGPYVRGTDPEYEFYRDSDKDGVVCE